MSLGPSWLCPDVTIEFKCSDTCILVIHIASHPDIPYFNNGALVIHRQNISNSYKMCKRIIDIYIYCIYYIYVKI